jgi:polyferredoxin/YHS domain-containing protein
MGRLKIAFPYILFALMIGFVIWSNMRERTQSPINYAEATQTMAAMGDGSKSSLIPADPNICQHCGKNIPEGTAISNARNIAAFNFCCNECRDAYLDSRLAKREKKKSSSIIDPVCGMEVNPAWGISHTYSGTAFNFCTEMCRNAFAASPLAFLAERCMVCRQPVIVAKALPATYLGETYYLCTQEHRKEFKSDSAKYFMHRMWGIPDWLYYISIALLLAVSFLMFEGASLLKKKLGLGQSSEKNHNNKSDRIDLMRFSIVRKALCSRPFRFFARLFFVTAFFLIISVGLFGNQNPALNLAPLLTWTIWWCGLVVVIMFAGKIWCYVCPWDAISSWIEKLSFWKKSDEGLGLGLPWPGIIRNISLATILFVSLTWFEIGFNVTMRPVFTAYLGIAMVIMAIVSAFLFERRGFCRYGCLVGRVSGLYALFSGVEVRHKRQSICKNCSGKECYNGSKTSYGCPTFEFPAKMEKNTYCIQCAECFQSCPHDNLALNLRPWGEDLKVPGKARTDEAYMALLMLAVTAFHGLTMTPIWAKLTDVLTRTLPFGRIGAFSLSMAVVMGFPIAIYAIFVWLSRWAAASGDPSVLSTFSYHDYFTRYAYCLLPIALFYHLAHNLEHLLMEGPKIFALLSDPFGWGWNLLGTAGVSIPPITSLDVLWILQVILVGVGHIYSLWAAQKISRHTFSSNSAALRGQWFMLAVMITFSIFSLWLLKQPMEMRTSAM